MEKITIEITGTTERLQQLHYVVKVAIGQSWEVIKNYIQFLEFQKGLQTRTPLVPALPELNIMGITKEKVGQLRRSL
jgi:hypothetical protein